MCGPFAKCWGGLWTREAHCGDSRCPCMLPPVLHPGATWCLMAARLRLRAPRSSTSPRQAGSACGGRARTMGGSPSCWLRSMSWSSSLRPPDAAGHGDAPADRSLGIPMTSGLAHSRVAPTSAPPHRPLWLKPCLCQSTIVR